MTTAFLTVDVPFAAEAEELGVPLPLDALHEPGTYVCNWSGNLLRVHDDDTARFTAVSRAPQHQWTVTRISPDPHLSRFEAKTLAGNLGLATTF